MMPPQVLVWAEQEPMQQLLPTVQCMPSPRQLWALQ
jgi:hypothetical protein